MFPLLTSNKYVPAGLYSYLLTKYSIKVPIFEYSPLRQNSYTSEDFFLDTVFYFNAAENYIGEQFMWSTYFRLQTR